VWAETESDTKWTSRVVYQAGRREGQLSLMSVLVSVFGSKRVELRLAKEALKSSGIS
jgi:hypothetical protein